MADDRIPQAQSDVLEASGKRFTLPWFRFFAALDGILGTIAESASLGLLKANNLSDVASAAAAFGNIKQSASGTTTGVVQQKQLAFWSHTIPEVENGTFPLGWTVAAGRIDSSFTICTSGTCSVRWRINGVNVGSAANSVSSIFDGEIHSTANTFAAGVFIDYVISDNSSCLNAIVQANVTYDLAA
jgi:hypothetical protein